MQVRNSRYCALIEGFTSTTYAMIIASDPSIQPASILINIEASRAHFESLIANMSNAANALAGPGNGATGGIAAGIAPGAAEGGGADSGLVGLA